MTTTKSKEKLLSFDADMIQPQDFKYLFSEDLHNFQFFKEIEAGTYFITKFKNRLRMYLVTDNNASTYVSRTPFTIQRNIYTYPNISLNNSFITYDNDNTLNFDKSRFDLTNNFLLHKKFTNSRSEIDIIILKNQLLQNDIFSASNNTLSSSQNSISINGFREYSTISQTIQEENSEDLSLNYVFYNKSYLIKPGYNYFTSPSSLTPFTNLNINDSKFIESGAFSFDTPQYADKVYHLSNDTKNYDNGQYLLCTWLSGSPIGVNKVWVDRYYYPDRIEKSDAFSSKPSYETTYDDYIENLISSDSNISSSVDKYKFFDKVSDLSFKPSQKYLYERVGDFSPESLSSTANICNTYVTNYPENYFKTINSNNKFTIGFYFKGDNNNWVVKSDHNDLICGLSFTKTGYSLTINYDLYDPSDGEEGQHQIFTKTTNIKKLKDNFVCVSMDNTTGLGYFLLNNEVILTFDKNKFEIYEYINKQLLYGDFFIYKGSNKISLLSYSDGDIYDIVLSDKYTPPNLAFIIPILNKTSKIDDIYITLPCGMRNSVDDLENLQSVCGSSMFKSNQINIHLKNTNIINTNVIQGVKDSITSSVSEFLPINTTIHSIELDNYKP